MNTAEVFSGTVELFDRPGGWYYVAVPSELCEPYYDLQDRGLIAITACAALDGKEISWPTSLLPMGDGSHFIALPAKVRNRLKVAVGDDIEITFSLRDR